MRVPALSLAMLILAAYGAAAAPLALGIASAQEVVDKSTGDSVLDLTLTPDSAKTFAKFTAANVGRTVELSIDGVVVMSAILRDPITSGRLQISGTFDPSELDDLVARINAKKAKVAVEAIPG